jgi:DNA-binding beta-propeller fold protein YncE
LVIRLAVASVAGITLAAACSSSTGPATLSHPQGIVAVSPAIASRPFAVAISRDGIAYVGRQDVPFLQSTTLPGLAFADSVRVGSDPTDIAFNSTGTIAYVTNQFSGNIGVVDVISGVTTDSIAVSGAPFRVLVAPNNTQLLVSSNNDSVYAIGVASKSVLHRWGFNAPVNGMTLMSNGALLYVSSIGGKLYKLNSNGTGPVDSVQLGGTPQDLAVSRDGTELFVANENGSLEVRSPATLALIDTIPGAAGAFGLKGTPDDIQLYATYPGAGLIRIIDRATRTVGPTLAVGGIPRRIAFDRLGLTALIPNEAGFVTVVR